MKPPEATARKDSEMRYYTDEQLKLMTDGTPFELPIVIRTMEGERQFVNTITDLRLNVHMLDVFETGEMMFECLGHSWDDEDWLEQMRKYILTTIEQ